MTAADDAPERSVPAPQLAEVSRTWWDVEHDPVVTWDAAGLRFELVDPRATTSRLELVELRTPPIDPHHVATSLADAFAACDFPPTGRGVPVASAVQVARDLGLDPSPLPAAERGTGR